MDKTCQARFTRTALLLGSPALSLLQQKKVAIFGLGGVGSYVAETLARSGIGSFLLVDDDEIALSNINRQLFALTSTIGQPKVIVARQRLLDINPAAAITIKQQRYLPETAAAFDLADCDCIIDAVDTLEAKVKLVLEAERLAIPIVSSMGAGNRLSPEHFHLATLAKTCVCPLAKRMRQALRRCNYDLKKLPVVYSDEVPLNLDTAEQTITQAKENSSKRPIGSIAFVTASAGLLLASAVLDIILHSKQNN